MWVRDSFLGDFLFLYRLPSPPPPPPPIIRGRRRRRARGKMRTPVVVPRSVLVRFPRRELLPRTRKSAKAVHSTRISSSSKRAPLLPASCRMRDKIFVNETAPRRGSLSRADRGNSISGALKREKEKEREGELLSRARLSRRSARAKRFHVEGA